MKHPPRNIDQSCFDWQKIILKKTSLPYQSKYLALYLASYMNMDRDFAWPGLRTIQRETGMSHGTVLKYMNLLVSEGWIGKESGNRVDSNQYWITFPDGVGQELTYVRREVGVGQEVTRNNKVNNNTSFKGFKRPTILEIANYCKEKDYTIDPETFINHYNSNGWKVGKASMKCWKSACSNWNKREKQNGHNRTKPQNSGIMEVSISANQGHDYVG